MYQFFQNRKALIAAVCILLLVCLVYFTAQDRQSLTVAERAMRELFAPVARLGSSVGNRLSSWIGFVRSIRDLKAENERLMAELDRVSKENIALLEAATENRSLRQLLELREQVPARTIGARIILRDPSNWLSSVVIDRGTRDGVEMGMAVLSPKGLVGRITAVTPNTSTVVLVIDSRNAVGAFILRSRDLVLVEGMGDGSGLLALKPLGPDPDIRMGDMVISSGLGGLYPRGHFVGDVVEITEGKYGVSVMAYVKPRVDFARLEHVLVLLSRQQGPYGVDGGQAR